jgi:preprotein translocase subunit YajC
MEKVSTARIALKWGLICALLSIMFTTISYSTEIWKSWIISLIVSMVLYFGVMYFAMKEFKEQNSGFMTFSQGLSIGTLISATSGLIGMSFDMIYKKFIDPSLITKQLEMAREQYENFGLSDEQIEEAIAKAESSTSSGLTFLWGVLIILFFGFLASLIMSAVMKNDKSIFE